VPPIVFTVAVAAWVTGVHPHPLRLPSRACEPVGDVSSPSCCPPQMAIKMLAALRDHVSKVERMREQHDSAVWSAALRNEFVTVSGAPTAPPPPTHKVRWALKYT
jgi:hypothetical protein